MVTYNFGEKKNFPVIPEGIYSATIERVEELTAKSGNKYKRVTFKLYGDNAENRNVSGRLIWDNLVLLPQVEWKIQNLLFACGMPYKGEVKLSDDWSELVGKKLKIGVSQREFQGSLRNDVTNFYPLQTKVLTQKGKGKPSPKRDDIPVIEDDEEIDAKDIPF